MQHIQSNASHDLSIGALRSIVKLVGSTSYSEIATLIIHTLLIGTLAFIVRQSGMWLKERITGDLFPTAYISHSDPSYLWVRAWICQDPSTQSQLSNFELRTTDARNYRKSAGNGNIRRKIGVHNSSWESDEIIGQISPTHGQYLKIKHNAITSTVFWQREALQDFITTAHAHYFSKDSKEIMIFNQDCSGPKPIWSKPVCRPARPWKSIILPDSVKENLLADVEKFLDRKAWYNVRGIPHRRGYLLHGAPGSGKTTLATALASKLELDVYNIDPTQHGMSNETLAKLFRDCPPRSIVAIEDFDCVFATKEQQQSKDAQAGMANPIPDGTTNESKPSATTNTSRVRNPSNNILSSAVTLNGLLNAIDGMSSQEGCILNASTNFPEHLDTALRRPGRFDYIIAFTHATHSQAKDLYKNFYPTLEIDIDIDTTSSEKQVNTFTSTSTMDLDNLAEKFANTIVVPKEFISEDTPQKVFSMAALQAYLLTHVDAPLEAVEGVEDWAEAYTEDHVARKVVTAADTVLIAPPKRKSTVPKASVVQESAGLGAEMKVE